MYNRNKHSNRSTHALIVAYAALLLSLLSIITIVFIKL